MTNVTEKEIEGLIGIVESDYIDGEHPVDKWVWTWSANNFENQRTWAGIIVSLEKKGLAKADGNKGEDACVTITEAGFNVLKERSPKSIERWL